MITLSIATKKGTDMGTLPIVLNNKKILLLGAGKVALQKASVLFNNNIEFSIITEKLNSDIEQYSSKITIKKFKKEDIADYDTVIDATGDDNVYEILASIKREKNLLVNVVDKPQLCDFYFASLINYGKLKVAVSSSGASPTISQVVRDKIKNILPKELENFTDKKADLRKKGYINAVQTREETRKLLAKISLVGCGTGDPELLTIKAYKTIQEADVVLIDNLISSEIEELIPSTTMKIYVGKRKGYHSYTQDEINSLLLDYANKGLHVARLKSGDPYIFGRGVEEAMMLMEHGFQVEVIPGISSAIAGPSSAGIAPTARGYATNFSIVSAHLAGNRVNLEWVEMLKIKNHTTIVLMGLSRVEEIFQKANELGIDLETKVAIVANASRANQRVITGMLKELISMSQGVQRPAIIVFGEVVALHEILPHYTNQDKGTYNEKIA